MRRTEAQAQGLPATYNAHLSSRALDRGNAVHTETFVMFADSATSLAAAVGLQRRRPCGGFVR